jgi:tight adherence protein B
MNDLLDSLKGQAEVVPGWALALALIAAVVLIVVLIVLVFSGFGWMLRRTEPDDGPSLAESAAPLIRSRSAVGRFDQKFDRMVDGTQLGVSSETAIGWILLVGALTAVAVFAVSLDPIYSTIGLFVGGLMAFLFFAFLRNRRKRAIQEQLPDGCFQLARSLRAGLNLPDAMRESANYVSPPLSKLFNRAATAVALGESTGPAMRRVADDAATTEFDIFASVVTTHAERGGNLPAMLDRLAASIRDRNQYRGYFRSVTALARVSALFLALAAPVIVLMQYLFSREMFWKFYTPTDAMTTQVSTWVIGAAVVLEVLGLVWLAVLLRREEDI